MKRSVLFLLTIVLSLLSLAQHSAMLSGRFSIFTKDSIKCVLLLNNITKNTLVIKVPVQNGSFKQVLNISNPTYLYLTDGENYFNGLIEAGDSVVVNFDTLNKTRPVHFGGKGSEKFQFLYSFVQAKVYRKLVAQVTAARTTKHPFDHLLNYLDSTEASFMHQLNAIRQTMSQQSYSLLLADIKGSLLSNRHRSVGLIYHENIEETLRSRRGELTIRSATLLKNLMKFDDKFSFSSAVRRCPSSTGRR